MSSWLASPPPDAAIEIAPEGVSAAVVGGRGGEILVQAYASEPLAPGAVTASLVSHNVIDRAAVQSALRTVLERLGTRPRRVALIIPDVAARVSLIKFDRIPSSADDLDQLVRWQLKKSAPFPVDDALLSYSVGARTASGGGELVVALAKREVVREYESLCEDAGCHPGLVDLPTLSVVNLFLASDGAPPGDWLLVHMRPDYTSIAIMRGEDVIFFRSRPEGEEEALVDVVHQTTMYYQDRLAGQGFSRVLLGGMGQAAGMLEAAHRDLAERLGTAVQYIDPARIAVLTDRITASQQMLATLAPLVGVLMRTRKEAVGA
jgi:type IV pilus assembly protein PilM